MSEKQANIIEAATATFARYGVKRTTMGDIAEQAGISRQTLYSFYPNKDEILSAAIVSMADQMIQKVRSDVHSFFWFVPAEIVKPKTLYLRCKGQIRAS